MRANALDDGDTPSPPYNFWAICIAERSHHEKGTIRSIYIFWDRVFDSLRLGLDITPSSKCASCQRWRKGHTKQISDLKRENDWIRLMTHSKSLPSKDGWGAP